jgi:hypothetical protein
MQNVHLLQDRGAYTILRLDFLAPFLSRKKVHSNYFGHSKTVTPPFADKK